MSLSVGVLLTNLGSPEAPTPEAVRRYLAEFLSDRRIVDLPRPVWWPILHGVILRIRPRRSAALYRAIWGEEGSPLLAITNRQRARLGEALRHRFDEEIPVAMAMRYGRPSLAEGLAELRGQGVGRVLVLPLYPQYSATTTASTFDGIAQALRDQPEIPSLRFVSGYSDNDEYLHALTESIRLHQKQHGVPDRLIFSFHGIPQRYADAGDPYPEQCRNTVEKVVRRLGLADDQWLLCFQSRFGREPWLQPYTDATLERLAGEGVRHVQVICPGFAADCLETLEEIDQQNREIFLRAGGEAFGYIPALNDGDAHIAALVSVVERELAGWLPDPEAGHE
ncbi:MAG: ferrochelatase [Gammaproteobacteria bacterium]